MSETSSYLFADINEYNSFLDSILPEKYEMTRDLSDTKKHIYYPTPFQQAMADVLFTYWNVADESFNVIVNELVCTIKIVYLPNYKGAEERFCTGSASIPIQMSSKSTVNDFPSNKILNSIQYNLPAVRAMSIGNALETLGNIFGRNLSRKIDNKTACPKDLSLRKLVNSMLKKVENESK